MAAKGIVEGRGPSVFRPDDLITRAEFVKLLVSTADGGLTESKAEYMLPFSDVVSDSWEYRWIQAGYKAGWIEGTNDDCFEPAKTVKRQDAAVMIAKAMYSGEIPTASSVNRLSDFKDGALVSGYAREAMAVLLQRDLVQGDDLLRLNPTGTLTRAEAAMLLYRLFSNK